MKSDALIALSRLGLGLARMSRNVALSGWTGLWLGRGPGGCPNWIRERALWLHRLSRNLLEDTLRLGVRTAGDIPRSGLLACNHLSYVDILVLSSLAPAVFVAKWEVRSWPLFGWFARRAGTVFVRRDRRGDVRRVNAEVAELLRRGMLVVLFPEGTTTDGSRVLPFRTALLESAAASGATVTAASIDYGPDVEQARREVCYWGSMTLLPHLLRLMTRRGIEARVGFSKPQSADTDRKVLARMLHEETSTLHRAPPGLDRGPA